MIEHDQFFEQLRSTRDNLQLRACAGSGKSYGILEGAKRLKRNDQYVLVFNKAINEELTAKIADQNIPLRSMTTHAGGLQMIAADLGRRPRKMGADALESDKRDIQAYLERPDRRDWKRDLSAAMKLLGLAKNTMLSPDGCDENWVSRTAARNRMSLSDVGITAKAIRSRLEAALDRSTWNSVSFDDMLYLPAMLKMAHPRPPRVLYVDEAQDLNPCQHAMLVNGFNGARTVCVGDPFQSIFAWRGAHESSMDEMLRLLSQRIMKLTYTRRCPVSVVEEAAKICSDIKPLPTAPEGEVLEDVELEHSPSGMALSRRNAPLFSACLGMLREGKLARINGRNFEKTVTGFFEAVRRFTRPHGVAELPGAVRSLLAAERRKATGRFKTLEDVDAYMADQEDLAACVLAVAEGASSLDQIPRLIASLFSSPDGMLFSTVHRAKGMEAPVVYLLEPADFKCESQQETNVLYVAVTRAIESLRFVGEKPEALADSTDRGESVSDVEIRQEEIHAAP